MSFTVITAFPPREAGGKIKASGEVLILNADLLTSEDYNGDKGRSYKQAELFGVTTAKLRCSVIIDRNNQPMLVGSVLPPMDMGREIAAQMLRKAYPEGTAKKTTQAPAAAAA